MKQIRFIRFVTCRKNYHFKFKGNCQKKSNMTYEKLQSTNCIISCEIAKGFYCVFQFRNITSENNQWKY